MFRIQRLVELDNNATTAVSRPVCRRMAEVLRRHHGNPSGRYGTARAAAAIVQESRETVASCIGARPEEVFFTGSATEANNQVLRASCELRPSGTTRILSTPIEHPSIMSALEYLAGAGLEIGTIPVDSDGRVRLDRLEEEIDDRTFLVCCMLANNEIGTIQDVEKVSAIARSRGVPVLTDCVQALGKIPVDVAALGVDYATFSAHKLHGPKGVGALFVRADTPIAPLLHGGHQEFGLRAGTEPVHDIAGFAQACRAVPDLLAAGEAIAKRKRSLLARLRELSPGLAVNSPSRHCLPNTLSVRFPGVDNAELLAVLDITGVTVSVGSACHAARSEPSHVLLAIGLSEKQAGETIRISLSDRTTDRQLRYALRAFRDFFDGKAPSIPLIPASQVDEAFLFDEENYLLDVRFEVERRIQRGLPNSHEASVIAFARYIHQIPREKNVVVVCSTGIDATAIAYALHKRGFRSVSVLLGGIVAWQLQQPGLYRRLGGRNISKLKPRAREVGP